MNVVELLASMKRKFMLTRQEDIFADAILLLAGQIEAINNKLNGKTPAGVKLESDGSNRFDGE